MCKINRNRWLLSLSLALLLAFLCAVAMADVPVDQAHFPDENFRNVVLTLGDGDSVLTDQEIKNTTELICKYEGIKSLDGIEYFTALTKLDCSDNELTSLDVSGMTALTVLYCHCNQLTALDVSNNKALEQLYCSDNGLTALDVSNNKALEQLLCTDNQLTALDISNNTALETLSCRVNQLSELDVSNNTALTELNCEENQLSSLDVSNSTGLEQLYCYGNQLTTLNVSTNTALRFLHCTSNSLTELDVSNKPALEQLFCNNNQLTALDISNNTALTWLDCTNNKLTSLNVGKGAALEQLCCEKNQLKTLDVSKCEALAKLVLESEPVIDMGVRSYGRDVYLLSVDDTVSFITDNSIAVTRVTLNKTKHTLTRTGKQKNPTVRLKATVLPDNATDRSVTWTSDKPAVAKVDANGKVTALKAGTATITCTAKDGSGVKAACKITVKDAKVTKITLNKTKATLKVKGTLQLKVKKFTPAYPLNTRVKWTTSDKKIATVDKNGKVRARKAGKVVITCTATDGSKKYATCKITVR